MGRRVFDRLAQVVITMGGIAVIRALSVLFCPLLSPLHSLIILSCSRKRLVG
jgi:ABC-type uncharacterized transport system permease subunit